MCWTYISTLQTKMSLGACRKCLCWLSGLSGSPATSSTPTGQPQPVLNPRQPLQLLPTSNLPCSGLGTPFLASSVLCMQEGWSNKTQSSSNTRRYDIATSSTKHTLIHGLISWWLTHRWRLFHDLAWWQLHLFHPKSDRVIRPHRLIWLIRITWMQINCWPGLVHRR